MASLISDRATDEVLEALTRYKRGLGISDSPHSFIEDPQTPDTTRSRSSQVPDFLIYLEWVSYKVYVKFYRVPTELGNLKSAAWICPN